MANAVPALDIYARFVRGYHARNELRILGLYPALPAYAVGALVYREHIAYAVTCAVVVVHAPAPEGSPGYGVHIIARAALWEPEGEQRKHAFQHYGKGLLFLFCDRPEGYGAGYVGSAAHVLPAGIHQQQPLRLYGYIRLGGGGIVYYGSVGAVARDSLKAGVHIPFLLFAEALKHICGLHFGISLFCVGLCPVHEAGNGHAVLYVGLAEVLKLHRILYGLQQLHRIHIHHPAPRYALIQLVVQYGQCAHYGVLLAVAAYELIYGVIWQYLCIQSPEVRRYGGRLGSVHEYIRLLLFNYGVGQGHGKIQHVVATYIEQPSYIRKIRKYACIGIALCHLGADSLKLIR